MSKSAIFNIINYAIIFSLIFFSGYIPVPEGLPPKSMQVLGIFVGTLWGWIVFSMGWPSIFGLIAFGMCGYLPMNGALSAAFGTQLIITVMALFLLAAFVEQLNLTEFMLDFLLSRKICQGRPYVIFYFILIAGYVASMLSFCGGVFVIMIGFVKVMMQKLDIKPHSKTIVYIFVGIMVAMLLSELTLPFKATGIYSIATYEVATGNKVNLLMYTIFITPISFSMATLYVLLGKYVFKPDMSMFNTYSHEARGSLRLDKQQKISLIGTIIGMLSLLLPSVIPASWPVKSTFGELGPAGLSLLVIGVLMAMRVDGKPLMNLGKVGKFFLWDVFFCLAFLYPVAGAISSDALGFKPLLVGEGEVFFRSISPMLAVICLIVLPAFLTNFMNNAVIGITSLTIYGSISSLIPVNPNIMFILITCAANLGFFFPAANPIMTMGFAEKGIASSRQLVTFGLVIWAIMCVWTGVACFLNGSLLY